MEKVGRKKEKWRIRKSEIERKEGDKKGRG